jgi:uncharacterized membrane protein
MLHLLSITTTFIVMIALDYLYMRSNQSYLIKFFGNINHGNTDFKLQYGLLAWFLMTIGLYFIIMPLSHDYKSAMAYGALFGLVLYGVYDFTNLATINNWSTQFAIMDITWGTTLCSVTSLLLYSIIDSAILS